MSDEAYEQSLRAIEQVIADETESDEILRRAVDLLHGGFDSYSWVGVYFVEGEELALGPWNGSRWKESADGVFVVPRDMETLESSAG